MKYVANSIKTIELKCDNFPFLFRRNFIGNLPNKIRIIKIHEDSYKFANKMPIKSILILNFRLRFNKSLLSVLKLNTVNTIIKLHSNSYLFKSIANKNPEYNIYDSHDIDYEYIIYNAQEFENQFYKVEKYKKTFNPKTAKNTKIDDVE